MSRSPVNVAAEIHGFSEPAVFRVRPVRGLGFRKGDASSQTTWRFER